MLQSTNIIYNGATSNAEVHIHFSNGGEYSFITPLTSEKYNSIYAVAQEIGRRVVNSGKLIQDNSNTKDEKAITATMISLLRLQAEGIDTVESLKTPKFIESMVDCCIRNQMMAHMHLSDALVLELNGSNKDGIAESTWQSRVMTAPSSIKQVASPVL